MNPYTFLSFFPALAARITVKKFQKSWKVQIHMKGGENLFNFIKNHG
jgi:hypothetical protein